MMTLLEGAMVTVFCAAVLLLIFRLAKEQGKKKGPERLLALTFCVGFAIGTVNQIVEGRNYWLLFPYLAGAMLSYTAFVFTLPCGGARAK